MLVGAEQAGGEPTVVGPRRCRVDRRQLGEVDLGEATHERAHVRQPVLARGVHDRRYEVGQHRRGACPADQVEQLERLLRVDRPVAVRQQVVGDDAGEPRAQVLGGAARLQRGEHERLGRFELLRLDRGAERCGGVGRQRRRRAGERVHGAVALGLGDPGDALHDRQGALIALVEIDHRQAVGRRGDGVPPAELGARRAVGHGLPDQLAGVGTGLEEADDVAGDLAGVVAFDPPAEAGEQLRPLGGRIGLDERHRDRPVVADVDVVAAHVLLAEHARAVADAELPVVPGARQQVALQLALGEAVPLVRAGVIDGEDALARADEAQPSAVDADHLHRRDGEVVDVGHYGRRAHGEHGRTSTKVEVKGAVRHAVTAMRRRWRTSLALHPVSSTSFVPAG